MNLKRSTLQELSLHKISDGVLVKYYAGVCNISFDL